MSANQNDEKNAEGQRYTAECCFCPWTELCYGPDEADEAAEKHETNTGHNTRTVGVGR